MCLETFLSLKEEWKWRNASTNSAKTAILRSSLKISSVTLKTSFADWTSMQRALVFVSRYSNWVASVLMTLFLCSNICKTVVELSSSLLYCAFTFLCLGLCEDHLFPTLHCVLPLQLSRLAGISCWRQILVFPFCFVQFLKYGETIKRDIQLCLHFRKHIQKQWNILVRTRRWPLQALSFHCLFVSAKRTRSGWWDLGCSQLHFRKLSDLFSV